MWFWVCVNNSGDLAMVGDEYLFLKKNKMWISESFFALNLQQMTKLKIGEGLRMDSDACFSECLNLSGL